MLFYKRAIYNPALKPVANEILAEESTEPLTKHQIKTFCNFVCSMFTEESNTNKPLKLLVPYRFAPYSKELSEEIQKHIVIKVNVRSDNEKITHIIDDLSDKHTPYAVDIKDKEITDGLPKDATFYLVDNIFITHFGNAFLDKIDHQRLIIKNIKTYDELEKVKPLNAGYYTGDFMAKPKTDINETHISANKANVLRLLSKLNDPNVEFNELTQIITADNMLSYKLLRIVNSPLFRGVNKLESIQRAVVRFGYLNLKRWGLMLSLASISNKPQELTKITVERAVMCANSATQKQNRDLFYTTGLFSTLDAFFDAPIENLLEDISLVDEVKEAILYHQGEAGLALEKVLAFQEGVLTNKDSDITQIYLDSVKETRNTLMLLGIQNSG